MNQRISTAPKIFLLALLLCAAALCLPPRDTAPLNSTAAAQGTPPQCVTPPSGMTLWLPFDETAGVLANDLAGVNNVGAHGPAAARPSPTPGQVAGALSFDGNDFVRVAHAVDIDFLGDCVLDAAESFTIDFWVRTTSTASLQTILDKRTHPGDPNRPTGYHVYLANGRPGLQLANGGNFTNFTAPTAVNDGRWHFVAITVQRCRPAPGNIYVDNNPPFTFQPLIANLSNPAPLLIGRRHAIFTDNFFTGGLDELEIFKRALSAAEVQSIFNAGTAGKCKPCPPMGCEKATFAAPVSYPSGRNPQFPATADFDGDGDLDLGVPNGGGNNLSSLLNNGSAVFAPATNSPFATANAPLSAAAGYFNGDTIPDLAVPSQQSTARVAILLGQGNGQFSSATIANAGPDPVFVAAADFDGDGRQDLAAANLGSSNVFVLKGDGSGGFTAFTGSPVAVGTNPNSLVVGDFNGDDNADIATANRGANSVSILLGNGDGTFAAATSVAVGTFPVYVAVGDFNEDGNQDLVASNRTGGSVTVLRGAGNGTFTPFGSPFAAGGGPGALAVADFNFDGDLDVAVANSGGVAVLCGNGDGTFTAPANFTVPGIASGLVAGDFNGDGSPDLAVTNGNGENVSILLNTCRPTAVTIAIAPNSLNPGTVGQPFTQNFTVAGGMGPYTFSLLSGALPNGVTLNPNGTLSGTPTETGTFTFTVKVTDKNGCMGTVTITWRIICPPITITLATLANGTAGVNYGPVNLTATGGMAPYTFAVTSGMLPMMMTLSSTGQLTGVPMQTGNFSFTVTVTDRFGCTGTRNYALTIDCQTITIGPANMTLPDAMQGMNYNPVQPPPQTFTATGGCGQNVFTISSGMLPAGMTLTSGGALVGTPTQTGDFEFTIKVTDKCGCMATKVYKLKVTCPLRSLLSRELFNTGVNDNGVLLPIFAADAHYTGTLPNLNPFTPLAVTPFPGWLVDNTSPSQWISPFANHRGPAGTYSYRYAFPLDTCDPSTVIITGRWMADNSGQILLNGTPVPGGTITGNTGFLQWQPFTINAGFGPGLNVIEFRVNNQSGATGLRVEFIRATAKCCECVMTPLANMVAWWPLDEPKGATVVNDLIGGHHGTPLVSGSVGVGNAATAIAGAVAGAFNFTQPTQQVAVPHAATLDFGVNSFSIDAWIRTGQANASVSKVIVEKFDPTQNRGYSFRVEANRLVLRLGDGAVQTFMSASTITFTQWQFVAVTIDRTAGTVRFHLGNLSGGFVTDAALPIPATFGGVNNSANLRIGGIEIAVDEVELFRRALSGAEFETISDAGSAGKCKPCVRPKITLNPVSLNLCPNKPAVFTAAASGSPVPVVQWQCSLDNGATWTNLANATGTTLVIAPGAVKNGAKYRAVFTNACCEATSAAAMVNVIQPPIFCLDTLNPGNIATRVGGRGSISVVLPPGTPLTATSSVPWLTIDAVESGTPASFAVQQADVTGLVNYTAAPNDGAAGRVGALSIGGQSFVVTQGGANPVVTVSAAKFGTLPVTGDSIVSAFGTGLATATLAATTTPLPTTLGGTQVRVLDAAGTERLAPLFFVSAGQINYLIPPGTAAGPALVTVTAGDGRISTGAVEISPVAPGLFTANASGRGVPAANALLFRPDGSFTSQAVSQFDAATNRFVPVPLDLGPENNRLFLVLFGTGIKSRTELAAVTCRIGGIDAPVLFAGPQGGFVGLDQINVEVPRDLLGRGEVEVELTVDGQTTNVVTINIR